MVKFACLYFSATSFSFATTTSIIVEKILNNLENASSPGISGIPIKILKATTALFVPALTSLFNQCILTSQLPVEWKSDVVTPLYKRKGDVSDANNYRGISVLPPVAKLFEKILATQITIYLNINNILFSGQRGFRSAHSCETALHEQKINA